MSTKTKRLRVLNQIYSTLPSIECKGLCWNTCSVINVLPAEVMNIEAGTGVAPELEAISGPIGNGMPILKPTATGCCPYLRLRRCTIHQHRPLICRLYGVADGMPCPHGCRPTKPFSDRDAERAFEEIRKL